MISSLFIYKCKLIRVIDGDTIEALIDLGFDTWTMRTIRLINIDTPEIRTKDLTEKKFGLIAKEEVISILSKTINDENEIYFYLQSIDYDSWGRCLGIVETIDGVNLNEYLLENGFAEEYKD